MRQTFLTRKAKIDLIEIWAYIGKDNIQAADRIIAAIYKKCRLLAKSPEIGKKRDELASNLRSFVIGKYVIFYRIRDKTFEVIRILHGSRDISNF